MKKNKKNKELMEQEAKRQEHKEELMEELIQVQKRIDLLYHNLSYVVEPELIDSCIYELNAFQSRYTFILKQVKKADMNMEMSTNM